MKFVATSLLLIFGAAALFVAGHSKGIASILFLASLLCTLIYLQDKKMPVLQKRVFCSLVGIVYAGFLAIWSHYLFPQAPVDFLLVGIAFAGFGWFFEDLVKFI